MYKVKIRTEALPGPHTDHKYCHNSQLEPQFYAKCLEL